MPQLNPNPWFLIMILSWAILMIITLPKTIKHKPTNPISQLTLEKQTTTWNWPW
uniref:ATP synthase complex subunit 8 n=1 Tax=Grandisonia alternans TaxID=8448 RepID=A0A173GLF5_GRAAL|nr:ATP synthase F0 subunit 8 [Grandisonia alternans]ANH55847.1 ATP synthase F0 subunit 8 [Grandisonia alternans]